MTGGSGIRHTGLPVEKILDELATTLGGRRTAVLGGPPGSGKTTLIPLALVREPWLQGRRIVMLEPRRLAARAAAARMAHLLGESVGDSVGYRVRFDTRVSPDTRIEVVTEGVLARRLQRDPALEGVGLVIFDEFHERSVESDLALAFVLDCMGGLRDDLKVLLMSATLDEARVARWLDDAPVVSCEGRTHAVTVHYEERDADEMAPARIAAAVRRALVEHDGDVLVFLPGGREIRMVGKALGDLHETGAIVVRPLYGDLPAPAQDLAITPDAGGRRRVVLATNVAESSLTIEGVGVVVDSGLARAPRFNPNTGLSRLETIRISKASAKQRAGRAGRLGPGVCLRLWTETAHDRLRDHDAPEILAADLAPLALELASWGVADPAELRWLDAPPGGAFAQGRELLVELGALDARGKVTRDGKRMAELPAHPRLACMLIEAGSRTRTGLACVLAALLEEGEVLTGRDGPRPADIVERVEAIRAWQRERAAGARAAGASPGACARVARAADALARRSKTSTREALDHIEPQVIAALLLLAYPDRLAAKRAGSRDRYRLASGRGARLHEHDALAGREYLVLPSLDAGTREARAYVAAAVDLATIRATCSGRIEHVDRVGWDEAEQAAVARSEERLGALVIGSRRSGEPDVGALRDAMLDGIRRMGLQALPWTDACEAWRARVGSLARWRPDDGWPDVEDAGLEQRLEEWLGPYLAGVTRRSHLQRLDLQRLLRGLLPPALHARLEEGAPTHVEVASGSRIRLGYLPGEAPVLAVRVQELFGTTDTPRVCWGEVPVMLHLLSPARRPVQITRDLEGFWARGYPQVRRELKGRYPKHAWPEDPLAATPTSRASRRGRGAAR